MLRTEGTEDEKGASAAKQMVTFFGCFCDGMNVLQLYKKDPVFNVLVYQYLIQKLNEMRNVLGSDYDQVMSRIDPVILAGLKQ
jgi:hypothetical protein